MWSVSFCSFSIEGGAGSNVRRERKNQDQKLEERESRIKKNFGLAFVFILLQICNGTDINGIILTHIQHLMGGVFCVWCAKCAK